MQIQLPSSYNYKPGSRLIKPEKYDFRLYFKEKGAPVWTILYKDRQITKSFKRNFDFLDGIVSVEVDQSSPAGILKFILKISKVESRLNGAKLMG